MSPTQIARGSYKQEQRQTTTGTFYKLFCWG
jgi:hypothetical protein